MTAPSHETAGLLERVCDGFSCRVDRTDSLWHVTIDRADADATIAAVLDAVQRWLHEADVERTCVEVGDEQYVMTRNET